VRQRTLALLFGICILQVLSVGQTRVDIERQGKGVSHLSPPFVSPIRVGESLPADCTVGDLFFKTTAQPGNNIHVCHENGSWLPQGSGGQGSVEIIHQGQSLGVRPAINFIPGAGVQYVVTDTGSRIDVQQSLDTAYLMTKYLAQSGEVHYCASASDSGTAYTCAMQPALTAMTRGMTIHWVPDVTNSAGGITLSVDALGPHPVTLADGLTIPRAGDFRQGHLYPLWYDGSVFRVAQVPSTERVQTVMEYQAGSALFCSSNNGSGVTFSCSFAEPLTAYSVGMLVRWCPDVNSAGGPTTFEIDSLGPRPLRMQDGTANPRQDDLKAGELHLLWYDGAAFRVLEGRPRDMMTLHEHQSGTTLLCESFGTVAQDFQCVMTPTLDAYRRGMVVHWIPDADSAGGEASLNIDGLGTRAIKLADGLTDVMVKAFRAGYLTRLWFDGTVFRLLPESQTHDQGTERPTCEASRRGKIWFVPGADGETDSLAVCAKNADDEYDWRVIN
jgi:hypothetical protein